MAVRPLQTVTHTPAGAHINPITAKKMRIPQTFVFPSDRSNIAVHALSRGSYSGKNGSVSCRQPTHPGRYSLKRPALSDAHLVEGLPRWQTITQSPTLPSALHHPDAPKPILAYVPSQSKSVWGCLGSGTLVGALLSYFSKPVMLNGRVLHRHPKLHHPQ